MNADSFWLNPFVVCRRWTVMMSVDSKYIYSGLTYKVIGAVLEVSNTLGSGFLEKVYERALMKELELRGLRAEAQVPLSVFYKGECVGDYLADIVVEKVLLVELKHVLHLNGDHAAQCLNYLKASGLEVCLLVNFQPSKAEYRRLIRKGDDSLLISHV